jgi:hypothetical protein
VVLAAAVWAAAGRAVPVRAAPARLAAAGRDNEAKRIAGGFDPKIMNAQTSAIDLGSRSEASRADQFDAYRIAAI